MHDSIRNSENPLKPLKLTPKQFEPKVHRWLKTALMKDGIKEFTIEPQGIVEGDGGEYAIDSLVRITFAAGARITILAECKRCKRPVEREKMLALHAKLADVGAHKGMLFSTSGFQS